MQTKYEFSVHPGNEAARPPCATQVDEPPALVILPADRSPTDTVGASARFPVSACPAQASLQLPACASPGFRCSCSRSPARKQRKEFGIEGGWTLPATAPQCAGCGIPKGGQGPARPAAGGLRPGPWEHQLRRHRATDDDQCASAPPVRRQVAIPWTNMRTCSQNHRCIGENRRMSRVSDQPGGQCRGPADDYPWRPDGRSPDIRRDRAHHPERGVAADQRKPRL